MLVIRHAPLFASPDKHFAWPPRFFRWKWAAWMFGMLALTFYPYATEFRVYGGQHVS